MLNPFLYYIIISGCAPTLDEAMQIAIESLRSLAADNNYEMTNYCFITLYVRSITEYQALNRIYSEAVNFTNPPTRVCVECPLPEDCHVIMEAIAFKPPLRRRATLSTQESESFDEHQADVFCKRNTMHVQSISHWAPANIGPYSQSTKVFRFPFSMLCKNLK